MEPEKDWYDIAEEEFANGPIPDDPDEEFDERIFDDPEYDVEDLEERAGLKVPPPKMSPELEASLQRISNDRLSYVKDKSATPLTGNLASYFGVVNKVNHEPISLLAGCS